MTPDILRHLFRPAIIIFITSFSHHPSVCSRFLNIYFSLLAISGLDFSLLRGFAKLKKFQNPKKIGSGWVGPGPIWIKKNWKIVQKIILCVCTIRPCLAVHVAPQGVHVW